MKLPEELVEGLTFQGSDGPAEQLRESSVEKAPTRSEATFDRRSRHQTLDVVESRGPCNQGSIGVLMCGEKAYVEQVLVSSRAQLHVDEVVDADDEEASLVGARRGAQYDRVERSRIDHRMARDVDDFAPPEACAQPAPPAARFSDHEALRPQLLEQPRVCLHGEGDQIDVEGHSGKPSDPASDGEAADESDFGTASRAEVRHQGMRKIERVECHQAEGSAARCLRASLRRRPDDATLAGDVPLQSPSSEEPLRVVTLGGGHGQSTLLSALTRLACEVTAVVSIADDGGCSGKLRAELGMAPPGDLRRCLASLASDRQLAARFEERLSGGPEEGRSVGNLALSQAFVELGSIEAAVDWAARLLECRGRVLPAADTAGTLAVVDGGGDLAFGESHVEHGESTPFVANVVGVDHANPDALAAVRAAHVVFLGPGTFFGSTLAAVTTGDLGEAVVTSGARIVFIDNLAPEDGKRLGPGDAERILRDHLVILSGGESVAIDVLRHRDEGARVVMRQDGSSLIEAPIAQAGTCFHDVRLLSESIATYFLGGAVQPLSARAASMWPLRDRQAARAELESRVSAARARLQR